MTNSRRLSEWPCGSSTGSSRRGSASPSSALRLRHTLAKSASREQADLATSTLRMALRRFMSVPRHCPTAGRMTRSSSADTVGSSPPPRPWSTQHSASSTSRLTSTRARCSSGGSMPPWPSPQPGAIQLRPRSWASGPSCAASAARGSTSPGPSPNAGAPRSAASRAWHRSDRHCSAKRAKCLGVFSAALPRAAMMGALTDTCTSTAESVSKSVPTSAAR
mmetsp:Transcript_7460/g.25240  ORF Transcript_7460/g.25240 Transcript_7460/m.25240 type:complete len:220 (-) Transcript_7460:297-956(-)